MKNYIKSKRAVMTIVLTLAFSMMFTAMPFESYAAGFSTKFTRIANQKVISLKKYPGLQGLAFDTYSGKDGYSFTTTLNSKKIALVHFTMNKKGKCKKKKVVKYKMANVGHVNDATLYRDSSGQKWIIFALYGSVSESFTAKATNGTVIQLGAIKVSDFNKGKAIVYPCELDGVRENLSDNVITGVTFTGTGTTGEGKGKPSFVVMGGTKLTRAYLVQSGNSLKLVGYGKKGYFTKPKFSNGKTPAYQGVTYHKGYLYFCAEGKSALPTTMLLCRQKAAQTFSESSGDTGLQVFQKKIAKQGKKKLIKNAPEAVFFTNLEGSSKLYLSVNRVDKKKGINSDSILRSKKSF